MSPDATPAARPTALDLAERDCPICRAGGQPELVHEASYDLSRLDGFAFASRKQPEYMHLKLLRCRRCDLLYASPAPRPEQLELAYRGAEYDSADEARYAARTYARLLRRVLASLPDRCGALDIGAGDGALASQLVALGLEGVVGVEPSLAPLEAAAGDVRPLLRHGSFDAADFEPESLRLVTCMATIEHVHDPQSLCDGARGLLRPGGVLVVSAHDRRAALNRALGRRSPIYDIEHLQLFSEPSLRALLEAAGLSDVGVRRFVNRYPLRYAARLAPLPAALKRPLLAALRGRAGSAAVPVPAGNLVAVGYRR